MSDNNSGGGCGCFTFIIMCLIAWALVFGVTINGKHYGVAGCDPDNGVQINGVDR